jgi:[ribosomal protein S5]-alanine N-acetyltransferase
MRLDIPQLHPNRVPLRGLEPRGFEAYAAMVADPEVTRYFADGRPLCRADARRQMAMMVGH